MKAYVRVDSEAAGALSRAVHNVEARLRRLDDGATDVSALRKDLGRLKRIAREACELTGHGGAEPQEETHRLFGRSVYGPER